MSSSCADPVLGLLGLLGRLNVWIQCWRDEINDTSLAVWLEGLKYSNLCHWLIHYQMTLLCDTQTDTTANSPYMVLRIKLDRGSIGTRGWVGCVAHCIIVTPQSPGIGFGVWGSSPRACQYKQALRRFLWAAQQTLWCNVHQCDLHLASVPCNFLYL